MTFTPGIRQALLMLKMLRKDKDKGASAVEYGLLVALIAAVIVTVVSLLGTQIQAGFDKVCDTVKTQGDCD